MARQLTVAGPYLSVLPFYAVRESLGDYSVTYGASGGAMRACGVPVSPEAVLCLRRAGLFSRWV